MKHINHNNQAHNASPAQLFRLPHQFFAARQHFLISESDMARIEQVLGYRFANRGLLVQAFTRASYHNEHPECPDNEVLELIGDSVLSLTVLTYFQEVYTKVSGFGMTSTWDEGDLSALKSLMVSKKPLANRMRELGLQSYLIATRGDRENGITRQDSVLEDLFESIIGGIYVDSGNDFARTSQIVREMLEISEMVQKKQDAVRISFRNDLQQWCQDKRRALDLPSFASKALPDGSFAVTVTIPNTSFSAVGRGKNLKLANEEASKKLLEQLEKLPSDALAKQEKAQNYVGSLQEHAQQHKNELPTYTDNGERQSGDGPLFSATCRYLGRSAKGSGSSKAKAKQEAARKMLELLN